MKNLWRLLLISAILFSVASSMTPAQNATLEVTSLLREFMDAAGRGDRAVFDKFFADDVIYTRATGVVITKADIMRSLGAPAPAAAGNTTYSAEDIVVHEYGDTVVVAFRLESRTEHAGGSTEKASYRNTGTFLRRNGHWQAVAWQATKIANPQ